MPIWEPAADWGLWALSDPRLSNPAKMRKKYCLVNIAVCPRLQLISHTQPTSTLSRIKCDIYIFIKKSVHSFIEVRILSVDCFRIYLYMYVARQHLHNEYPGKVTELSYGEAPVMMEICGMKSISSFSSLPGPLWSRVAAPNKVLSMGQIELFDI